MIVLKLDLCKQTEKIKRLCALTILLVYYTNKTHAKVKEAHSAKLTFDKFHIPRAIFLPTVTLH